MKHIIKRLMIWESIGYIILLVFVFGPALFPPTGQMIFGDDIHHQYYFFRQFLNQFLHSGSIPWWNPYIFGGQPFITDPMVNMWYPLNWLYISLPLNITKTYHSLVLLTSGYCELKPHRLSVRRNFWIKCWITSVRI